MEAAHFRLRAAHAREMAQFGEDLHLSRMLLEVALDLDAEADAMETERTTQLRRMALTTPVAAAGRVTG